MAIRGSLGEASLPDVLQLLALGRKSGCLSVSNRTNFGYVYLDAGKISYASIVNRRDRLGDLLVKGGLVSPEVLAQAIDAQAADSGKRLGEILVESGAISREQLEKHIRIQIEEAIYLLFTWTKGNFAFLPDETPEPGVLLVSLNPESVLLEGARRVDEWSLIAKKIPSLDLVFGVVPGNHPGAESLTAEQRKIYPLIDGTRSVHELVEESGLVEFDAAKALFGLVQAGMATQLGRKGATATLQATSERVEKHRNLGTAFYRTEMLADAGREFKAVLELNPDDLSSRFYLGIIELRLGRPRAAVRRFRELIERGGKWGAAFHNLALALEELGMVEDALFAIDEAWRQLGGVPALALSRAILLWKTGRARESAEAFDAYRARTGDAQPPAVYFAFAMLAEGARGRLEVARAMADEAASLYPSTPTILLHAGAVNERAGKWEEAEILFRRAVDADPRSARARTGLGEVLYRLGAHREAADQLEQSMALATEPSDDVAFKLGNAHYKLGDRATAVRLWRQALQLNPENSVARTNLELVERTLTGD